MSLKIRLTRAGAKKQAYYRIVVADSRSPRDGRFIEKVGTYNPRAAQESKDRLVVKEDRIKHWVSVGALPTDRVQRLFSKIGLAEAPTVNEQTKQNTPRAKAQERLKMAEEAAKAAAEAAASGEAQA
jgi:small subunit ribosomal protein S16